MGNRINFAGTARDPEKSTIRTADTPEVMLFPTDGDTNLCSTSNTSEINKNISFTVATGDKRVNFTHNDLQWYIIQAVSNWQVWFSGMTWKDQPFIVDVNITAITEGLTDDQVAKNIEGWASNITIRVRMRFATTLLRTE